MVRPVDKTIPIRCGPLFAVVQLKHADIVFPTHELALTITHHWNQSLNNMRRLLPYRKCFCK